MSGYTSSQNYVEYNNRKEIKELDQNVWHSTYGTIADGATGRHLYKAEPRHPAYGACFDGRDPETHYIYGVEKMEHPDHSSRFGYGRCKFGYCAGNQAGGRYMESEVCSDYDPQPQDMAPERFYNEDHQGPFNTNSQAQVDYNYWKNYGMNYPSWWKYPGESRE